MMNPQIKLKVKNYATYTSKHNTLFLEHISFLLSVPSEQKTVIENMNTHAPELNVGEGQTQNSPNAFQQLFDLLQNQNQAIHISFKSNSDIHWQPDTLSSITDEATEDINSDRQFSVQTRNNTDNDVPHIESKYFIFTLQHSNITKHLLHLPITDTSTNAKNDIVLGVSNEQHQQGTSQEIQEETVTTTEEQEPKVCDS